MERPDGLAPLALLVHHHAGTSVARFYHQCPDTPISMLSWTRPVDVSVGENSVQQAHLGTTQQSPSTRCWGRELMLYSPQSRAYEDSRVLYPPPAERRNGEENPKCKLWDIAHMSDWAHWRTYQTMDGCSLSSGRIWRNCDQCTRPPATPLHIHCNRLLLSKPWVRFPV